MINLSYFLQYIKTRLGSRLQFSLVSIKFVSDLNTKEDFFTKKNFYIKNFIHRKEFS